MFAHPGAETILYCQGEMLWPVIGSVLVTWYRFPAGSVLSFSDLGVTSNAQW